MIDAEELARLRANEARLRYLLEDDPRFRRLTDGTWAADDDDEIRGATQTDVLDGLMRRDGAR